MQSIIFIYGPRASSIASEIIATHLKYVIYDIEGHEDTSNKQGLVFHGIGSVRQVLESEAPPTEYSPIIGIVHQDFAPTNLQLETCKYIDGKPYITQVAIIPLVSNQQYVGYFTDLLYKRFKIAVHQ